MRLVRTPSVSNYSYDGTDPLGAVFCSSSSISISITSNFVSLIFSSRDGFKGSLFSSVSRLDPDHAIIRVHGRPPVFVFEMSQEEQTWSTEAPLLGQLDRHGSTKAGPY